MRARIASAEWKFPTMTLPSKLVTAILLLAGAAPAWSRGPSPYLPLNLSPEIERNIERALILAGKPVMRRPIAAATVLDALPAVCQRDRALCESVRLYLDRYMRKAAVTQASVEGAVTSGDSQATLPNRHGEGVQSAWTVAASAYYQPIDHLILSGGVVAYDGEVTPTGTLISMGWDFAQLDVGFRDHWLGPMTDSSSLISTEAPTMPSVTLSNYKPISALGFSYEIFGAEMSEIDNIVYEDGFTTGRPRLAGLQLSMEPVTGFAVGVNRITQYGGGARGGSGISDFFDALTTTSNSQGDSDVNRIASLGSSLLFPGRVPFAVRVEYAGEDNTYEGKARLGQTNFSLGLDLPLLWERFDASLELSEFQNGWYIHHVYPDGPRNEDHVIGHWFGDNRRPLDAVGGRSYFLRMGWRLPNGDYAQAGYRALDLDSRWTFSDTYESYETMQLLEVTYTTQVLGHSIDGRLQVGQDVFGDSFARVGAAFDFAAAVPRSRGTLTEYDEPSSGVEFFVDGGVQYSRAREILLLESQHSEWTSYETNYHFGVGARRRVSERSDLGVRLEIDEVADRTLVSFRAVDYRYRIGKKLALQAFGGVGRYDLTLDAYGYYLGGGLQYRNLMPGWDIGFDYRLYDKLNRDKGLPSDPESNPGLPRRFVDIDGFSFYVSKRW
jgi:hypothetical protein